MFVFKAPPKALVHRKGTQKEQPVCLFSPFHKTPRAPPFRHKRGGGHHRSVCRFLGGNFLGKLFHQKFFGWTIFPFNFRCENSAFCSNTKRSKDAPTASGGECRVHSKLGQFWCKIDQNWQSCTRQRKTYSHISPAHLRAPSCITPEG